MSKYYLFLMHFTIFTALGFTCSCTSLFVAESNPSQTEIFYITQKSGEKKLIGTTPLQLSMIEFKTKIGEDLQPGEFYKLRFEKKGFQTEEYHVPVSRFGTLATKIGITLTETKNDSSAAEQEKQAKTLIDRLFTAQRLAQLKEFERAQIEIDKILQDHPKFTRAMTMRAAIYFAQNNLPESIKWYEEALKIDPQMEDVLKLIAKIKGEKPSSSAPADRLPATKGGP